MVEIWRKHLARRVCKAAGYRSATRSALICYACQSIRVFWFMYRRGIWLSSQGSEHRLSRMDRCDIKMPGLDTIMPHILRRCI